MSGCDDSTTESDFYLQNSECKENIEVPAKNTIQIESPTVESEKRYSRQNSKSKETSVDSVSNKSSKASSYSRQSSRSSTCSEDASTGDRRRGSNSSRTNLVSIFYKLCL